MHAELTMVYVVARDPFVVISHSTNVLNAIFTHSVLNRCYDTHRIGDASTNH